MRVSRARAVFRLSASMVKVRYLMNISAAIKGSSLLWLIGFIHHQSFVAVVETSKKI